MSSRNTTIAAIVQARMGSTRLPGKTLADISGRPLLGHVFDRARASRLVEQVILATTNDPFDDPLAELAAREGVAVYRGSADDVLDRYYQAAKQFNAGLIVRVTADDPFKDPEVIDDIVGRLLGADQLDYASNTIEPTYPEGLDVEVFSFAALERAWTRAVLGSDREHVTPYIWRQPELFQVLNVRYSRDLSHLRWTLDYDCDLRFARAVYARLYGSGRVFLMHDILALLERDPALSEINQGIVRNAGYAHSLEVDRQSAGAAE